ncbi:Uma2 family endonuclease [Acidobacteria bacterium AH-259-G07]|nr:Uma2 family endonuclease [Acidobacteria bacterium AH-259-G07]
MAIQPKILTYSDYLQLPEQMKRYEIIDGEIIYLTPAPKEIHQRILRNLFRPLDHFVRQKRLGVVYFAPLDIIVRKKPLHTRQPDLIFISRELASIVRDQIEGGPDQVVEILSPGKTRTNIENKLKDYAQLTVQECWIVWR